MDPIEVGGLQIAYERSGDGPPLVLVHGYVGDGPSTWRPQLDELSDEFTVIAWDAPGAGRSSDPPEYFGIAGYADCLAGFIEELELTSPHLVGLSFGAALIIELCRRHPSVPASVTLVGGYAGWAGSLPPKEAGRRLRQALDLADGSPAELVAALLPSMFGDTVPSANVAEFRSALLGFHPAGLRAMARACAEDVRAALAHVRVPTLLVYGAHDARAPAAVADDLHRLIPHAELVVLPDAGHVCNLDAAGAFNDALRRFLRRHPAPIGASRPSEPTGMSDAGSARDAFDRREWRETHRLLSADPIDELGADDLERLAVASYLIGRDDDAIVAWERAHRRLLVAGDHGAAALCAFWAALCLMLRGQMAHASGWLSRTETTIGARDCAASGYLQIPALLGALDSGDGMAARDLAVQAVAVAERFDDRDLRAFAVLGHGQALLALGDRSGGTSRLDEVMLSVRSGEVGPIVSGIVYCAVVLECVQMFDLARAAEWTAALDTWCGAQPDLVPYRGQCLVHQSQLQQAAGDWSKAATTVASACERLADPPHPALGLACYQEAELLRLRGALDSAADAYARASRAGYQPMPGLALLERARGDKAAAVSSIRRALLETVAAFQRPPLLVAAVDILVAAGHPAEARDAAAELVAIASESPSPMLRAMADQARGSLALAVGEPARALPPLRAASQEWRRLHMPYEGARAAVLLGRGCLALGDRAAAELEFDNARVAFAALGARVDLDELATLTGGADGAGGAGLSSRELEVLAQVAEGKTNPEIARALSISVHTVGRHLENIFAKTGVSGRAAATAWAYEHDLL